MTKGIQYCTHESNKADEENVGKHDNEQLQDELPLFLYLKYPWNKEKRPFSQQDNTAENDNERSSYDVKKDEGLFSAALFDMFGKDRDEGGAESALTKEPAKQIRDFKGNGKGVPHHACAKDTGADHVPCKTQDAA